MTPLMQALTEALPVWEIEPVAEGNLTQGLEILASNREGYYALTGEPAPTLQNLREDLTHLPPGRSLCDKSFLLLSFDGKATALMDYVRGYPTEQTGYIGLLILHQNCHRQKLGTVLFQAVEQAARKTGARRLELGCFEANTPGLSFWRSNGFKVLRSCIHPDESGASQGNSRCLLVLEKNL